ncbi:MAG: hypothetical protein M3305_05510, partial [Actinomycetota bacterium]|nr:hypothetical protein [Actinomycetota bacterium]
MRAGAMFEAFTQDYHASHTKDSRIQAPIITLASRTPSFSETEFCNRARSRSSKSVRGDRANQRFTMSVVAPVGGCEERNCKRSAPVKASESASCSRTRERHAFREDARVVEQAEESERDGPGEDRHEVSDQGVAWARRR